MADEYCGPEKKNFGTGFPVPVPEARYDVWVGPVWADGEEDLP